VADVPQRGAPPLLTRLECSRTPYPANEHHGCREAVIFSAVAKTAVLGLVDAHHQFLGVNLASTRAECSGFAGCAGS